ncbi:MAG TPA: helix-turn-helix transcriptional regulator [Actinomycetota bacterium]
MKAAEVGVQLRRARRNAGLSQTRLAGRMKTSQSAIARAESGLVKPSLDFIERFVRETGEPLRLGSLIVFPASSRTEEDDRAERIRRAVGDFQFNPWLREPTPAEQRSLEADGLSRGYFEGPRTA